MTDSLTSMLFPHILKPTRVSSSSKILIDNIFSNTLSPDSVSRSHNCSMSLTVFLPHLQAVQIFMIVIGLILTKKSLFLPI